MMCQTCSPAANMAFLFQGEAGGLPSDCFNGVKFSGSYELSSSFALTHLKEQPKAKILMRSEHLHINAK